MERLKRDERILGSDSFVREILKISQDQFEWKYTLKRAGHDLKRLAGKVAKAFQMTEEEILRKGKYPKMVQARSVYFY